MPAANAGVINITHGGTYTFVIGNNNPSVPAVSVRTRELVVFRQCTIFSHGTAIETEVEGANMFVDHTTISILGPSGVGVGGTGKGVEAIEPEFLWIDHCEIDGAANGIYVLGHPTDPTETKAQITINFTRFRNCRNAWQLNGVHADPNVAMNWDEVLSLPGSLKRGQSTNLDRHTGTMWLASTARTARGRTWCSGIQSYQPVTFRARNRSTTGRLRWLTKLPNGQHGKRNLQQTELSWDHRY